MQWLKQKFGWDDFPQPLFYSSQFALRFDLGGDHPMGIARFMQAIDRARAIATLLFTESQSLIVAVPYFARRASSPAPAILRRALKDTGFAGRILSNQRMAPREEDDEDYSAAGYRRYFCMLEVDNNPDQILPFVWASIADEMPIAPGFPCLARGYILDVRQGIILYPYDDRGMDAIAVNPEALWPCYEQFNGWLLDHDRDRMDAMFAQASAEAR